MESVVWTWLSDERFGWRRTSSVLKLEWIHQLQEVFRELDQHLEQVVVAEAPAVESGSFARVDSEFSQYRCTMTLCAPVSVQTE